MLQIYVYDDTGASFELDLYKEDPVKITLSAEDIGDIPRVNSAFSKQFRVPATQTNSKVFKWWYEVNTIDFDITRRVRADLYSDGLFYKSGHIRIQNAFVNETTSQVDLELVFFGETRDFASQVGEITLPELTELHAYDHVLTTNYIQANWQATDAPIRYILADKGYTYDGNNPAGPIQNTIAITSWDNRFTQMNHPITLSQFTPMIQAKAIIDAIFAQTGYTYSDDSFFNETLFKQVYVDGIPNPSPFIAQDPALFEAHGTGQALSPFGSIEYVEFPNEISDPTNSYTPATNFYFPPVDATYTLNTTVNLSMGRSVGFLSPDYRISISQGGTIIADTGFVSVPSGIGQYKVKVDLSGTATLLGFDGNINKAVSVQVSFQNTNGNNSVEAFDDATGLLPTLFSCTSVSETTVSVPSLLKYDIKSIDFLKSIITKFKLIMVPSQDNEFEFIIKPWKDYIGSGNRIDWTEKMDVSKDIQLKPVFFEQSQIISLTDQQDEDHMNKPFQDEYNRAYGALQFDSQSDLLDGERKVETIFAPTPVNLVEGADLVTSQFIIPFFSKLGDEITTHNHLQHVPMRPKPRILFWNGIASIPVAEKWWYEGLNDLGVLTKYSSTDAPLNNGYPRATPYSEFPTTANTLNLNWYREISLFPNGEGQLGESVYERYWNRYVKELYSPLSRVLTAYFNLDSQDIRTIAFKDVVFIKNAYYRVLKIYDAPLTDIQTVKVDLVKLLDTATFANNGTPTPTGGGIDDVIVLGGGGTDIPLGDDVWGGNDNTFGGDTGTWGGGGVPPTYFYHTVQNCVNPGDTFVARHTSLIAIGDSVQMSGVIHVGECYEVIAHTVAPEDTTVLAVFPDCFSCAQ